jgi:hypothetical protein
MPAGIAVDVQRRPNGVRVDVELGFKALDLRAKDGDTEPE